MNNKEMNSKEMDNKEMANKKIQKNERDERAARRSRLREAAPESKKPRLDLLEMLSSSSPTSVLDILTASGTKPVPNLSEETESRPGVLDIFDALPKDGMAEDQEVAVEMEVEALEEDPMEYYNKKDEAVTFEEVLAITTSGAEEASSVGGGLHIADESFFGVEFDSDAQATLAAKDNTSNTTRQGREFMSMS